MGNALRWSVDQLAAYNARVARPKPRARGPRTRPEPVVFPRAGLNTVGMNKLEAAYAQHLEARRAAGEIADFGFERIKLRLARSTFYTPDFDVVLLDGAVEIHETKGYWQEDARIKIKVAAGMFPAFRFFGIRKRKARDGGGWDVERF